LIVETSTEEVDMEQEDDIELETIPLEETLETLKRNANAVEVHLQESIKHLKRLRKQLAEDSKDLSEMPLQPRTRMMKWLTERGLPVESTFAEFFEVFIEEHKKDHRLDLSQRTVQLNSGACVLFGLKEQNPVMTLFDLLEKLPLLYV
jgi:hypothetical protein